MKRLAAGLFLLVLFAVVAASAYALLAVTPQRPQGIEVQAVGDVPAETMADVRQAASEFSEMTETAGVPLEHGVSLYVTPTQDAYAQVLTQRFSHAAESAEKIAALSGGWTGGKEGQTALNGAAGVMQNKSDRMSTTAHELFHQLQYDLSHGSDADEKSLFWFEEGTADYVGALVASRCGGKSLRKWERDTLLDLRMAKETARWQDLLHADAAQRMQLMEKKYHSYQLADAMVICLMERQEKGQELASIVRYFQALADARDGETAFAKAFGMTHAQFLQVFQQWYAQEQQLPFAAEFSARPGVSQSFAAAVEVQTAAAQPLLVRLYGQQLRGRYDIILAADAEDFTQAIEEACCVPRAKAQTLAAGSLWIQDGSTIIVQAGELGDERQRIFSIAALCARLLHTQLAGSSEAPVDWLDRGMTYLTGIRALEQAGYGHYADYRRSWQYGLRKAPAVPSLDQLLTADGMREAATGYGDDVVNEVTELAADELMRRFGWGSYRTYLLKARSSGSEQVAFRETFGRDTAAFAREFEMARTSRR